MKRQTCDVLVIGAGAAGLAAAAKAKEMGAETVFLLDEKEDAGGVLPQCIHPGFGLHYLKEDLTGPEFAVRLHESAKSVGVKIVNSAYVMEFLARSGKKKVTVVGPERLLEFHCKTVVFATGARERHSFEIGIVGGRPAGVYTAGEAQTMMDLYGVMPGREIAVVGSGDVGLIMARRFALQGANVKAVIEILPYPGGLARNVQQCLLDFGIPLCLSRKAVRILGKKRVEGLTVAEVDENLNDVPGTEFEVKCDTVVVSAGLIPRTELLERAGADMDPATKSVVVNELFETSIPGVFAAGNALIINDLVDYAAMQGETAATGAVAFIRNGGILSGRWLPVVKGRNMRALVPQQVSGERDAFFYGRVSEPEEKVYLRVPEVGKELLQLRVKPPEMLTFKILQKSFEMLRGDKLTVTVEPRE
ncbi:MAG: NAD(P)/FAD-dependent oxidoreductase [Candidatus Bathyarchaeota archaeon]|nr:NAD(P)/FAD-dependent oxidoreductase [Candidatus Bathyarchaeota archaeon]